MGALFDVYVVGPAQAGADPTELATVLAGRLGIAAPAVIKGLTDRKLCAGRGLETGAAQTLVRDLRGPFTTGATSARPYQRRRDHGGKPVIGALARRR
jgi:hypothetical protein